MIHVPCRSDILWFCPAHNVITQAVLFFYMISWREWILKARSHIWLARVIGRFKTCSLSTALCQALCWWTIPERSTELSGNREEGHTFSSGESDWEFQESWGLSQALIRRPSTAGRKRSSSGETEFKAENSLHYGECTLCLSTCQPLGIPAAHSKEGKSRDRWPEVDVGRRHKGAIQRSMSFTLKARKCFNLHDRDLHSEK